ncbi:MarR family winged helix-turn-helix transcriptional regulator [Domibacillus enclensis]|uniref:DNA-binding transcriptional regulator, MarR family n=1 Tax=Domibacillus enclensis TaxID=1017273 RepID=A0A1N7A356_9BACI|nr:MarR family transcriptional regulator [Domibacillus enclensis]OXS75680.1 MarR family transcriptional regulator [Domibacillus enclensis]SIR33478.1 DNA-binding transcriptional regulator, MarR family [Domibacillus enclensis]
MNIALKEYISIFIHQTDLNITSCVKERLACFNLAPEQNLIMMLLWERDGRTQQELSEQLEKDKTNITRMLSSLEQKGFVKKRMESCDRRSIRVFLTEKGKELECQVIPVTEEFHRLATAGITEEELAIVRRVLSKMSQNVKGQKN